MDNWIVISDYDSGWHTAIYIDGQIYRAGEKFYDLPDKYRKLFVLIQDEQWQKIAEMYGRTVMLCQDGGIEIFNAATAPEYRE